MKKYTLTIVLLIIIIALGGLLAFQVNAKNNDKKINDTSVSEAVINKEGKSCQSDSECGGFSCVEFSPGIKACSSGLLGSLCDPNKLNCKNGSICINALLNADFEYNVCSDKKEFSACNTISGCLEGLECKVLNTFPTPVCVNSQSIANRSEGETCNDEFVCSDGLSCRLDSDNISKCFDTSTPINCGSLDDDKDGTISAYDFLKFAKVYKFNCIQEEGGNNNTCGKKDSDGNGKIEIKDFLNFATKFGQSCK